MYVWLILIVLLNSFAADPHLSKVLEREQANLLAVVSAPGI